MGGKDGLRDTNESYAQSVASSAIFTVQGRYTIDSMYFINVYGALLLLSFTRTKGIARATVPRRGSTCMLSSTTPILTQVSFRASAYRQQ
jgi:hypothetical protein